MPGTMICRNCGVKIPREGDVCPMCKADKTAARAKLEAEERRGAKLGVLVAVGVALSAGAVGFVMYLIDVALR